MKPQRSTSLVDQSQRLVSRAEEAMHRTGTLVTCSVESMQSWRHRRAEFEQQVSPRRDNHETAAETHHEA